MYFITDQEVFRAEVVEIQVPGGEHVRRWRVRIRDDRQIIQRETIVEYTDMFGPTPEDFSDNDFKFWAIRCLAFKKPNHPNEIAEFGWGSGSYDELTESQALSDDQLEYEILKIVWRFFRKYPVNTLSYIDLQASINANTEQIKARTDALSILGYLIRRQGGFVCDKDVFNRIEDRINRDDI